MRRKKSTEPPASGANTEATIDALRRMTVGQLRDRYLALFSEPTRSGNRDFLFKRIAWRTQSLAEGGSSERAKRRAEELARDADVRLGPLLLGPYRAGLVRVEPLRPARAGVVLGAGQLDRAVAGQGGPEPLEVGPAEVGVRQVASGDRAEPLKVAEVGPDERPWVIGLPVARM